MQSESQQTPDRSTEPALLLRIDIVRETEEEWEKKRSSPPVTPGILTGNPVFVATKPAVRDPDVLHAPLSTLIPVERVRTIYVPFGPKGADDVPDASLIDILKRGIVVNEDEIVCNAFGKFYTVVFDDGSHVGLQLMVGGSEGHLVLSDGTTYWVKVPEENAEPFDARRAGNGKAGQL